MDQPTWTEFKEIPDPDLPEGLEGEVFINSRYQVVKRFVGTGEFGPLWHLSIKRLDREAMHDWRELQRIKNELVGPEAEGIEIYPRESRLVDASNQYHLWVFEEFSFPFGFGERLVSEASLDGKSRQRPFEKKPKDLASSLKIHMRTKFEIKNRSRK